MTIYLKFIKETSEIILEKKIV